MTDPNDEAAAEPSMPAGPLDYRSPSTADRRSTRTTSAHVLAGFWLWVLGVVLTFTSARPIAGALHAALAGSGFPTLLGITPGQTQVGVVVAMVGTTVAAAVWIRVRWQTRGLLLGLLLGVLLTCLVPIGIVAVVCGGFR